MDPECEAIVLFTSTTKRVRHRISIDRRIPPNMTSVYEPSTVQILKLDSARYYFFGQFGFPTAIGKGYDGTTCRMEPNINFRACTRILAIRLTKGSDR